MSNLDIDHDPDQKAGSTTALKCFSLDEAEETPASYPMRKSLSRSEQLEELLLSLHDPDAPSDSAVRRKAETNQRQFARCPIVEERTSAILTANGRSYDCRLVELSIGGFGVVVPGLPGLPTGANGRLRAPGLNYVVTITRQEVRQGETFVGLRQDEEIVEPESRLPNVNRSLVGYLIAAVAGAFIATVMYYFRIGA